MMFKSTDPVSVIRSTNKNGQCLIETQKNTEIINPQTIAEIVEHKTEQNLSLEKSINMLINTITQNSKNNIFQPFDLTGLPKLDSNFDANLQQNAQNQIKSSPMLLNDICSQSIFIQQNQFLSKENQIQGIIQNEDLVQPDLDTLLNPLELIFTSTSQDKTNEVKKSDLEDFSRFIRERQELLETHQSESDFSFKVTSNAAYVTETVLKSIVTDKEIHLKEIAETSKDRLINENDFTENIFVNVLGETLGSKDNSPIKIIDQNFLADKFKCY